MYELVSQFKLLGAIYGIKYCMLFFYVTRVYHSKHKTLNQCWFNVGPASQTMGQHSPIIGFVLAVMFFVNPPPPVACNLEVPGSNPDRAGYLSLWLCICSAPNFS